MLTALLALPAALAIAAPASASCARPSIDVEPATASPGESVTVSGRSFGTECNDVVGPGETADLGEPDSDVRIEFVQDGQVRRLAVVAADPEYRFTVDVTVPNDARPGAATIVAHGDMGHPEQAIEVGAQASPSAAASPSQASGSGSAQTFAVCAPPLIEVDPATAAPGESVTVSGRDFRTACHDVVRPGEAPGQEDEPDRDVRIEFVQDGQVRRLAVVAADPKYRFTVNVTVPNDARPGAATIVAHGDMGHPEQAIDVTGEGSAEGSLARTGLPLALLGGATLLAVLVGMMLRRQSGVPKPG